MKVLFLILKRNKFLFLAILGILVVFLIFVFYRPKISFENRNGEMSEAKVLAKRVGELMFLPSDELPTIATVSDPEALKNQSFFVDAKRGDKVLIYSNARKAILYDPVANKIITIAPVNLSPEQNKNDLNLIQNKEGF